MEKLTCEECGTNFNCGAVPGKNHCWCMELPNMTGGFDLAGDCSCPGCLTQGQAKLITRQRKRRKKQREIERNLLR